MSTKNLILYFFNIFVDNRITNQSWILILNNLILCKYFKF